MNNPKIWLTIGGILGFLAVGFGAFGAHALEGKLISKMMEIYQTGVLYHLVHSLIIAAIGIAGREKFGIAALFFSIGIVLFSFSLYLYSLSGLKIFAMVTPVGGVSFLIGWILMFVEGVKISRKKQEA